MLKSVTTHAASSDHTHSEALAICVNQVKNFVWGLEKKIGSSTDLWYALMRTRLRDLRSSEFISHKPNLNKVIVYIYSN